MEDLLRHGEQALLLAVALSLPIILISAIVGIIVAVFQSASQIQEATLAHLPRFIAVVLALLVLGPWMGRELGAFAVRVYSLVGP